MKFSTKARTLEKLSRKLTKAKIQPLLIFQVCDWNNDKEKCIKIIFKKFQNKELIVRSSCHEEDKQNYSNAGKYLSIKNVTLNNIEDAVDSVISSYKSFDETNEILLQPMLEKVILSGVAFSHDPNTCSTYRVINWHVGENTSFVTDGIGGEAWILSGSQKSSSNKYLNKIIILIEELLKIFNSIPIDIEFAFTSEKKSIKLWLLQARKLILKKEPESLINHRSRLKVLEEKIEVKLKPHPFLMGKKTVFGVMPDWNPAEILGLKPKPLSLSLYKELITDSIWAYQRHNYGYRNLRSFPLMLDFFGLPYIDVRLSFNSFIPNDLEDKLANKLTDYYVNKLLSFPAYHDKIEFEIVFSSFTFDLEERLNELLNYNFTKIEINIIYKSLKKLTLPIIRYKSKLLKSDAEKLDLLNIRREKYLNSKLNTLEKIYWLIEDTKRYGTLPFAGLARAGFIAVQLLNSMCAIGILSNDEKDNFLLNISSISTMMKKDIKAFSKNIFLKKYGHLRPGTYDIESLRYDEAPDYFFNWNKTEKKDSTVEKLKKNHKFSISSTQRKKIHNLLLKHKLNINVDELFKFIERGIKLREFAKFEFTKNLSRILVLISDYGNKFNFSKSDMAYTQINLFKELYISTFNEKEQLEESIMRGKSQFDETLKISLPPIIKNAKDIWGFKVPEALPNFITNKKIIAKVKSFTNKSELNGAIICIPNADPGFDWLFSHNISGLITEWGGVNSHMAIRAGELDLPAIIGAGEINYKIWSNANKLLIDCEAKRVEVIN